MPPAEYRYCPYCRGDLSEFLDDGKLRKMCAQCAWTHYPRVALAITAVIRSKSGILLVQRGRDPFKGKWMLPSGYLEFGEHPREALIREVLEETGLAVASAELRGVFAPKDDPREPDHLVFVYDVVPQPGKLRNDAHENLSVGWFKAGEIPPIAWQLHREIALE